MLTLLVQGTTPGEQRPQSTSWHCSSCWNATSQPHSHCRLYSVSGHCLMLRLLSSFLQVCLSYLVRPSTGLYVYMLGSNLHFPLVHGGAPSSIQLSKNSSNVAPSGNLLREHKDLQSASFCSLLLPGAAHYLTHCPRHSFQSPGHQCSFSIYQKNSSLPNCTL